MKKVFLGLSIVISTFGAFGQTNCDSLIIDCCNFDLVGNDTISLNVENANTTWDFNYPGFILIASNGDTIAKETVNYFGIGVSPQTHFMQVQNPMVFPFTGTLELWGEFYDTLYCSFPISFLHLELNEKETELTVFPNPVRDKIHMKELERGSYSIFATDGKSISLDLTFENSLIDITSLPSGVYFFEFASENLRYTKKIIKE